MQCREFYAPFRRTAVPEKSRGRGTLITLHTLSKQQKNKKPGAANAVAYARRIRGVKLFPEMTAIGRLSEPFFSRVSRGKTLGTLLTESAQGQSQNAAIQSRASRSELKSCPCSLGHRVRALTVVGSYDTIGPVQRVHHPYGILTLFQQTR